MVACHNFDLNAAKAQGFRTAFVRRPDEWGAAGAAGSGTGSRPRHRGRTTSPNWHGPSGSPCEPPPTTPAPRGTAWGVPAVPASPGAKGAANRRKTGVRVRATARCGRGDAPPEIHYAAGLGAAGPPPSADAAAAADGRATDGMTTLIFAHASSADHDTGPGHPRTRGAGGGRRTGIGGKRPRRPAAPRGAEGGTGASRTGAFRGPCRPHAGRHAGTRGLIRFDPDTVASPGTREAALRAAGAVVAAVDAVMAGEARNAFCANRPPGHHAEAGRAMGFCFFNNVAVGAAHASATHGLAKVAVVDFDVHHGNGTQAIFWDRPDMFLASTHQMPLYPGTGAERETGAFGQIVNAPLPPGAGGDAFRARMGERVLPALEAFRPGLILVSAGFGRAPGGPLGATGPRNRGFRLGDACPAGGGGNASAGEGWSRRWRAAMTSRPCTTAWARMWARSRGE